MLRYLGKRKIFSFFRITDTEESISLDSIKFDLKFLQNLINRFLIKLIKVTDLKHNWKNERTNFSVGQINLLIVEDIEMMMMISTSLIIPTKAIKWR